MLPKDWLVVGAVIVSAVILFTFPPAELAKAVVMIGLIGWAEKNKVTR